MSSNMPGCAFSPKAGGASLPATTEILKGDNAGGAAAAVKGTDYPGLDTANSFTRGQTIAGSQNEKQLVVKRNGTQTQNTFEVQDSSGGRQFFVPPSGSSVAMGTADYRAQFGVNGAAVYSALGYFISSGGPYSSDGDLYNVKDCGFIRGRAGFIQPIDSAGNNGGIQFLQRTSGGTPSSNCACIYAKDVSGTAELFVLDEAGTETQISPHAMDGPAWLYDSADPFPQVDREANVYLGVIRWTNNSRANALRAKGQRETNAPGLKTTCIVLETFAEYEARTGNVEEVRNWHEDQAWNQALEDEARELERRELVRWLEEIEPLRQAFEAELAAHDSLPEAARAATPKPEAPKYPYQPRVRSNRDIRKNCPAWLAERCALAFDPREPEPPSLAARALAWLGVK